MGVVIFMVGVVTCAAAVVILVTCPVTEVPATGIAAGGGL